MHAVYLASATSEGHLFTTEQRAALDAIAILCPASHGSAVLTARSLRYQYTPHATYEDDCSETEGLTATNILAKAYGIIPNPTHTAFELRLEKPLNSELDLQLIGPTGQLVQRMRLASGTVSHRISTATLADGIYFLHGSNIDQTQVIAERIIVQH